MKTTKTTKTTKRIHVTRITTDGHEAYEIRTWNGWTWSFYAETPEYQTMCSIVCGL